MSPSLRSRVFFLGALLGVPALHACMDATSVHRLEVGATAVVFGTAYIDNDGNGVLDTQDPPLKGVPIVLAAPQGGSVISQATTDSTGFFLLTDVPAGSYTVRADTVALGDSLSAVGTTPEVTLELGDTTPVNLPVSYPVVSLEEARASQPGRRVITNGIALNPRLSYGDGVVHFQLDSAFLRATNVARVGVSVGDSVRLLGRVKIDQGEPVLDDVTPFVLVTTAAVPVPTEVSTAEATTADGGRLDAALVRIHSAEILDTATVNGDFHFHVDDGSGPVDIVIRSFLQLGTSSIRPDTVLRVKDLTGLLTPLQDQASGQVSWRILPRGGSDVVFEVKQADLGLGLSVDKPTVSMGDTLVFTVVASNAGPLGASGVQVFDTVPQGLTFVSASTTRGPYDAAAGSWTLDSLRVGATDTLRIRATVTTTLTGQTTDRATTGKLRHEVDPNPNNNVAAVSVLIVAPPAPSPDRSAVPIFRHPYGS